MIIRDAIRAAIADYSNPRSSVSTGFLELDRLIGGFMAGEVTVIGATSGGGKTSLMSCFSLYAATNPLVRLAVIFSREMTMESIVLMNLVPPILPPSVTVSDLRDRAVPVDTLELHLETCGLSNLPIEIVDEHECGGGQMTVSYIADYCERNNPSIVFIDYLQILDSEGDSFSREREVAKIMAGLSGIAKRRKIPVVLLAQLNRESSEKKDKKKGKDDDDEEVMPEKKHLRESAVIDHFAQSIVLLWQRGKKLETPGNRIITAVIAKSRNGESRAPNEYGFHVVDMLFIGRNKLFLEHSRAEEHYDDLQGRIRQFAPF